jgi:hypothetical protein
MGLFNWHKHRWVVKDTRFPVLIEQVSSNPYSGGSTYISRGTAVYEVCAECGKGRIRELAGRVEEWHGELISVPKKKENK